MSFPPGRLPAIPQSWLKPVRIVWLLLLAATILLDLAGTGYALKESYDYQRRFALIGLETQDEDDGTITVEPLTRIEHSPVFPQGSRIVAVDGEPVTADARMAELAGRLPHKSGVDVRLTLAAPDGKSVRLNVRSSADNVRENADVLLSRDSRIAMRLAISLLACATLIGCAAMLAFRRPADPVAMLFSVSFLLFAATIDPPLRMWLAFGFGTAFDIVTGVAWALMVCGLAAFPDGRFAPGWMRWILVAVPFGTLIILLEGVPEALAAAALLAMPLATLFSQMVKYRAYEPGVERQQIKYAAFGFACGFVLVGIAFAITQIYAADVHPMLGLLVLAAFEFGFLAMAAGLLISLIRFRLWEADEVISRSAISALVTAIVGIIWTSSLDMVKAAVASVLGEGNDGFATLLGAVLAAAIFAPSQAFALRLARRRIDKDDERMKKLPGRLAVWQATESQDEIAARTLAVLAISIHCSRCAIALDTPAGLVRIAERRSADADLYDSGSGESAEFPIRLTIEDEDGPMGELLIGERSDRNRYNADDRKHLDAILEPLAEALRAARKRAQHLDAMREQIGSVEERLAMLERGARPDPA